MTRSWPSSAGCQGTASPRRSPGCRGPSAGTGSRSSARRWRAGSSWRPKGHLDPRQLTAALAAVIISRGGVIRTGECGSGTSSSAAARSSPSGPVTAARTRWPGRQRVVIAAGALSVPVTRKLGARLPMTAGKGYSVSVGCPQLPEAPMYLVETRVGATPMAGRLRLAGTIEFSGLNSRLDQRRIASLVRAARSFFPAADWTDVAEEWTGMRPLCPDGLPVLDRVPGTGNAYPRDWPLHAGDHARRRHRRAHGRVRPHRDAAPGAASVPLPQLHRPSRRPVMVARDPSTTGARPTVIFRQLPNARSGGPVITSCT